MKKLVGLFIVILSTLVAATAGAGEWSDAFGEESLPEELFDVSVVVVVEGPQSERVGRILVNRLDESGHGEARMNPVLSRVGTRSDEEVVRELEHLPAEVIIVLRTYSEEHITASDARKLAGLRLQRELELTEADSIPLEENLEADLGRMAVYAIDGTSIGVVAVYPGETLSQMERLVMGDTLREVVLEADEPLVETTPLGVEDDEERWEDDDESMEVADEIDEQEEDDRDAQVDEESDENGEVEQKALDEMDFGEPENEERYEMLGLEDEFYLQDHWDARTFTDVQMYRRLDDDWAAQFESNRSSRIKRLTLSFAVATAGVAATTIGAHNWVEGAREIIPRWKSDICHREVVVDRRNECLDAVHHDMYGTQIRGGQVALASGGLALTLGVVGVVRAKRRPLQPVSTEEILRRVEEINDGEDWETLQREREEQLRKEEEKRRQEREEQRQREEPREREERRRGGGMQADLDSTPPAPMRAVVGQQGVSFGVQPYFEPWQGSGGLSVWFQW